MWEGGRTHVEWRIALRGGRRQAALMRIIGRGVRGLLQQNFDALLAHLERTTAA
jgi:hypothetical protein